MVRKLLKPLMYLNAAAACMPFCLAAALNIPVAEEKAIQDSFSTLAQEPGSVIFTPPEGWLLADPKALPPNVKAMVVGKGAYEYPPSLNLTTEKYNGTLRQYLKIVKAINENKGDEWKDLGTIRTEAGDASLSQVDTKSKWGSERFMHVILVKNGTAYILTAAALKDEFPKFYRDFFNSMRSLRINKDALEMVKDDKRRTSLQKSLVDLKQSWSVYYQNFKQNAPVFQQNDMKKAAFDSSDFQQKYWIPFKNMLAKDFGDMGPTWQKAMLSKAQNELLD